MSYTSLRQLAVACIFLLLLQACKKDKPPVIQSFTYTVTDTTGKTYSFSDVVSSTLDSAGATRYCFNGNTDNCQWMPDAYIIYDKSTSGDYIFNWTVESDYYRDEQNRIYLPRNAVYMNTVALQNADATMIPEGMHTLSLRLNNIVQVVFATATVNTAGTLHNDGTASGTFQIIGHIGTAANHYTITGQFTNIKFFNL